MSPAIRQPSAALAGIARTLSMLRDIEAFETEEEPPDGALDDAFDTEMPSTKRLANHSAPRPT